MALKESEKSGGESHPITVATKLREARQRMGLLQREIDNRSRPELADTCHKINPRICGFSDTPG